MPLYYCHQCRRSVNLRDGDLRCSSCNGEFIEETRMPEFGVRIGAAFPNENSGTEGENSGAEPSLDSWIRNMFNNPERQQQPQAGDPTNPQQQPRTNQQLQGDLLETLIRHGRGVHIGQPVNVAGGQPLSLHVTIGPQGFMIDSGQQPAGVNMEGLVGRIPDMLNEILNQLGAGGAGGDGMPRSQGFPDQLVQRYLPMTKVTQKHVDNGAQCTTCFDTFKLDEEVAALDCEHIFHRPCIEPWLKTKSSCPVCRQPIDMNVWKRKYEETQQQAQFNILEDLD